MEGKKLKVILAIQARLGSKRLPNKMLLEVAGQKVFEHVIERTLRAKQPDQVVLSTTDRPEDAVLVEIAKKWGIPVFKGSERDVAGRLYHTLLQFNGDALMRLNADHLFVDPDIIDKVISAYRERANKVDFVTNCLPLTFPEGLNVELLSKKVLQYVNENIQDIEQREAFIIFVANHPEMFPSYTVKNNQDLSSYRLNLDYPEDLELAKKIYEHFSSINKKDFRLADILEFLKANPSLPEINRHRIDKNKYPHKLDAEAIKKSL